MLLFSPQIIMLVVVRVRRTLDLGQGMLFQLLHDHLDRLLQLSIVALTVSGGVEIDFDIGRDAVVFDLPFAVQAIDGSARGGDVAAVNQPRIASNADMGRCRYSMM